MMTVNKQTKAFTMIELIFIIVIIGILAAVAIPKLAATRDDAELSALMTNTKICVNDLVASYRGNEVLTDMDTIPACVEAKVKGASIVYSGDVIRVSTVEASIDGDYVYKGTSVLY